jgi:hypothetical protein
VHNWPFTTSVVARSGLNAKELANSRTTLPPVHNETRGRNIREGSLPFSTVIIVIVVVLVRVVIRVRPTRIPVIVHAAQQRSTDVNRKRYHLLGHWFSISILDYNRPALAVVGTALTMASIASNSRADW